MKDITVIIPLHKFNDEVKPLLERAIKSVPKDIKINISCGVNVEEDKIAYINDLSEMITILKPTNNNEKDDFCTLVNRNVGLIDTKWFSILEYDDTYTDIWFKNVEEYIKYNAETSVFLPLTDLIDFENNEFIGYGNEAPWATSFSNEIGEIDNDCLQEFFDFYLTGGVYNTNDWRENGGLKPSIKLTFWYEFLLRMTNNGKKIQVIPKVGYTHYLNRKDSLMNTYKESINEKESEWWFNLAKQECFYNKDREKKYEEK